MSGSFFRALRVTLEFVTLWCLLITKSNLYSSHLINLIQTCSVYIWSLLIYRMAVASEDPSDPAVNLQPLTSESHVNSTSSASEGRDEGTEIVEEQPLTVSIRDVEPDAHMNGKIAQPVQRPRTRKYMETAALYSGYFSRVWLISILR